MEKKQSNPELRLESGDVWLDCRNKSANPVSWVLVGKGWCCKAAWCASAPAATADQAMQ